MIRSCDNEIQFPFTPKAARLRRASCPVVAYRRVGIFKNATMKNGFIHGHSSAKHPAYKTYICWQNMKARCKNKKVHNYRNYGGRGIKVCDRWRNSFTNFLADMGEQPAGMTIERVNVNGNYEPSNCKWANKSDQSSNQTSNRMIEFNGVSRTTAEWGRVLGFKNGKLKTRVDILGWSIEKALTTP